MRWIHFKGFEAIHRIIFFKSREVAVAYLHAQQAPHQRTQLHLRERYVCCWGCAGLRRVGAVRAQRAAAERRWRWQGQCVASGGNFAPILQQQWACGTAQLVGYRKLC